MYIDYLQSNIREYPYVRAMLSLPHIVLSESVEHIALYSPASNVIDIECKDAELDLNPILANAGDALIQITNSHLFDAYRERYPIFTELVQFVFDKPVEHRNPCFQQLHDDETQEGSDREPGNP